MRKAEVVKALGVDALQKTIEKIDEAILILDLTIEGLDETRKQLGG